MTDSDSVLMKYSDPSELLQLRAYLSIKHHVAGRIRVVFSTALLDSIPRTEAGRLQDLLSGMRGVREVRLNLPARSVVVSYDPAQIPAQLLVDLIEGDDRVATKALKTLTARVAPSRSRTKRGGEA
ncbi:MAG: hypothetical protein ACFCVA_12170 [Gammaproteobacteria bacterium]